MICGATCVTGRSRASRGLPSAPDHGLTLQQNFGNLVSLGEAFRLPHEGRVLVSDLCLRRSRMRAPLVRARRVMLALATTSRQPCLLHHRLQQARP